MSDEVWSKQEIEKLPQIFDPKDASQLHFQFLHTTSFSKLILPLLDSLTNFLSLFRWILRRWRPH